MLPSRSMRSGVQRRRRQRLTVIGHSVGATITIGSRATASSSPGQSCSARQFEPAPRSCAGSRNGSPRHCAGTHGSSAGRFLRRQERHPATAARRRPVTSCESAADDLPARWFREYMAYDPTADLRAIRCPVLAITGRSDIQVDPEDVARIGKLIEARLPARHRKRSLTCSAGPGPAGLSTYRAQLKRPVDPSCSNGSLSGFQAALERRSTLRYSGRARPPRTARSGMRARLLGRGRGG